MMNNNKNEQLPLNKEKKHGEKSMVYLFLGSISGLIAAFSLLCFIITISINWVAAVMFFFITAVFGTFAFILLIENKKEKLPEKTETPMKAEIPSKREVPQKSKPEINPYRNKIIVRSIFSAIFGVIGLIQLIRFFVYFQSKFFTATFAFFFGIFFLALACVIFKEVFNYKSSKSIVSNKSTTKNNPVGRKVEVSNDKVSIENQMPLKQLSDEMECFLDFEGLTVHIIYKDRKGEISEREIVVSSIRESLYEAGYYMQAHCLKANEQRTFTIKNVISTTVADQEVDLIDYLVDMYQSSSFYKTKMIIKEKKNEIIVLNYIALLDGRLLKKEKETVVTFLEISHPGINKEITTKLLKEIRPSAQEFRRAIKALKNNNNLEDLKEFALVISGKDAMKISAMEMIPV